MKPPFAGIVDHIKSEIALKVVERIRCYGKKTITSCFLKYHNIYIATVCNNGRRDKYTSIKTRIFSVCPPPPPSNLSTPNYRARKCNNIARTSWGCKYYEPTVLGGGGGVAQAETILKLNSAKFESAILIFVL